MTLPTFYRQGRKDSLIIYPIAPASITPSPLAEAIVFVCVNFPTQWASGMHPTRRHSSTLLDMDKLGILDIGKQHF